MRSAGLAFATFLLLASPVWAAVDVNTATKEELEAQGMGPVAAQALVDYRTKNGPFKSADEVRKVIDEAIAKKLSIGISIAGPAPEKSASVAKPASPEPAKSAAPPAPPNEKAAESKAPADDAKGDNVRNRARKDQDDRKT